VNVSTRIETASVACLASALLYFTALQARAEPSPDCESMICRGITGVYYCDLEISAEYQQSTCVDCIVGRCVNTGIPFSSCTPINERVFGRLGTAADPSCACIYGPGPRFSVANVEAVVTGMGPFIDYGQRNVCIV
jgi:hypothetical protein